MASGNFLLFFDSIECAFFFGWRQAMTYANKLYARVVSLAKSPVFKDSFAGNDVRFSHEFEALERELGKAQSLHESVPIDWLAVQEHSEALLCDQSKDLRVGVWLTWALYQRESFNGLLAGLGLLHHLCTRQWALIHPLKPRTRAAAISWLTVRLDRALNDSIPLQEQLPLFRHMVELLLELERVLTLHLGDEVPLLLPVCRRLSRMVERAADNQQAPGPLSSMVAQVRHVATQLIENTSPIDSEKDAQKSLRALQHNARTLCVWWLKQNATDLRALRLNRTLTWMAIDVAPERNGEHITPVRGPAAQTLKTFDQQFELQQFADLLMALEACLSKAPFWFDGQRRVWACLSALKADVAMREVEQHMALLLQRLPGLAQLRFSDGTPFADPQTHDWIATCVMPHLQTQPAPESVAPNVARPLWEVALQEAQEVARSSGFKSAVQQLKRGLASAQNERERFHWQLTLARLCFLSKKYELAKTQLEMLDQLLQRSGLQAWEPQLVLEVIRLLHRCCELLPQSHDVRERKDEMYRRLCHLDLEVVLE